MSVIALAAAGMLLTACDPVTAIVVTTTVDGSDADPGDGVCEMTPGLGDCSLRAAFDEGATTLNGALTVPAGTYPLTVVDADGSADLDVAGRVSVNWSSGEAVVLTGDAAHAERVLVDVQPGAKLSARGVSMFDGRLQIAGDVVVDRFSIRVTPVSSSGVRVVVLAGGSIAAGNSVIFGIGGGVESSGTATFVYSTIYTSNTGGGPSIATNGSGVTTLQAVRFMPFGIFRGSWANSEQILCAGNLPISNGGNWGPNASCQLSGPADVQTATTYGTGTGRSYVNTWRDMIPFGVAGCGTASTVDAAGAPRPADDDGDGIAACDAGEREGGS